MKPRRVVVTIEIESDMKVKDLKEALLRGFELQVVTRTTIVKQVQANIIQEKK